MLPHEDGAILKPNNPHRMEMRLYDIESDRYTAQHLYIIGEEPIKTGDWYTDDVNAIRKAVTSDPSYWKTRKDYMKIIASTNESLAIYEEPVTSKLSMFKGMVPGIPATFISTFISSYNKNTPIEWVNVEYEDKGIEEWMGDAYSGEPVWIEDIQLSITPRENTVSISLIKENWNREEVIALIKAKTIRDTGAITDEDFKWMNENL